MECWVNDNNCDGVVTKDSPGATWHCNAHRHPADLYTKDLEDMLQRVVEAFDAWFGGGSGSINYPADSALIIEAKTLLERIGYTEDF